MMNRNQLLSKYFGDRSIGFWIFFVFASIVYIIQTYRFSSEIPYLDDYEALLQFLISVELEPSWIKKIGFLFQQHNEHRIVIPRILIWCQYLITGELNLRTTLIIGNLLLIGICFILIRHFFNKSLWALPLTTILLLMNYAHFENYQWALAALQNFGVILLALISIVLVSKNKLGGALIFACLAAFTSASGFLLLVTYALYYLLNKKYAYSMVYFSFILVAYLLFYRWGYQSVHQHPGIVNVLKSPREFIQYYFTLHASFTSPFFREAPQYAMLLGILLWTSNLFITIKFILNKANGRWVLVSLFMNFVLVTIAYTRFNFGIDQAFASRYMVYSTIYLLLSLSMIFQRQSDYIPLRNLTTGILFLLFGSYHSYCAKLKYHSYVVGVKTHLNNTLCAYKAGTKPTLSYIGKNDPNMILKNAEQLGLLHFSLSSCNDD